MGMKNVYSVNFLSTTSLNLFQPIKDPETKKPITTSSGHVEYVRFLSDFETVGYYNQTFTIKFRRFSNIGIGWYFLTEEGGGLSWQVKGKI